MKLTPLTKEQAAKEWPVISKLLALADAYALGRYTAEDLLRDSENDVVRFIIAWEPEEHAVYAVFAVQVDVYPKKRVFNVVHAGGVEMEKWIGLYPWLRQIAKDVGCDQIQIAGRPGWGRLLKAYVREQGRIFAEDL